MDFGIILLAIVIVGAGLVFVLSSRPAESDSEEGYYRSFDKVPDHPEDEARRRQI